MKIREKRTVEYPQKAFEQVLEAEEITKEMIYDQVAQDGSKTQISEAELKTALQETRQETYFDEGYMGLATTIMLNGSIGGSDRYDIIGEHLWFRKPMFLFEDVLAINSNANYYSGGGVWGQSNTSVNCSFNGAPCNTISDNSYWFEKDQPSSNGSFTFGTGGVGLRFNMYDVTSLHGGSSGAHHMTNWNMANFVGCSILVPSNVGAVVQTAYSHKEISLGSISVSLSSSGSGSIGFSLSGSKTDFFGEGLTILPK